MDRNIKTELEIEMFGKAKDLQAGWKPQRGDWFYKADGLGQGTWLICRIIGRTLWCSGEGMKREEFKNRLVEFMAPQNYTWIPSIESLLEIVSHRDFVINNESIASSPDFKLMLLAVVMREKYGRSWQGNTWRKLKKSKK